MLNSIKIGIIGGTGIDDPDILENRREININTPYGSPSDAIIEGQIKNVSCSLLARHGRHHTIMPSSVNYRANIWALKNVGCTHIIVSTATGSLQEHIRPGDIIILDDFIDRTTKRSLTFYDGSPESPKGICHIPMYPSFCPHTSEILYAAAKEFDINLPNNTHKSGTVVTIEGPRFSTRAESNLYRKWGADLVNMTTVPEVILAKELGIHYGAIAIATDYDCWIDGNTVCVEDVMKVFKQNTEKVKNIIIKAVEKISRKDWTKEINLLKGKVKESVML